MELSTRKELEQLLEDIQSRLSVIETAQTKPEDEKSKDESSEEPAEEKTDEVESEDEIEKLLNA